MERNIRVIDKTGKELAPCTERVAWVLTSRHRAIRIDETTIKIVLTKQDIKRIKREAIARDGRVCHYCGKEIPLDEPATADHINPKIIRNGQAGYDTLENFVCACFDCNNHKGNTSYNDYVMLRISSLLAIVSFLSKIPVEELYNEYLKIEGVTFNENYNRKQHVRAATKQGSKEKIVHRVLSNNS